MSIVTKDLIEQQINHYLYKRADELHNKTKLEQLTKAAEKYPEPLEPDSWTALQCGLHAFQELVDLEHYVTMQVIKNERLEAKVKYLDEVILKAHFEKGEILALVEHLKEENKQLIIDNTKLEREIKKAFNYGR